MPSAKIDTNTLRNWNTGDTMGEADYEQERSMLVTAINSHATDIDNRYTKSEVDQIVNNATATSNILTGADFPTGTLTRGQQFYKDNGNGTYTLYIYNGTAWEIPVSRIATTTVMGGVKASTEISAASDGTITIVNSAVTDDKIGNRTIVDTSAPLIDGSANTGKLTDYLKWFANRIKGITGKSNWYDAPIKTIEQLNTDRSNLQTKVDKVYTDRITHSITAAGWYRIATSAQGINRNHGMFNVDFGVTGNHGRVILTAGSMYGSEQSAEILQLSYSSFTASPIISKARLVYNTGYTGNYAYLEVYATGACTLIFSGLDLYGWTLVSSLTAGSIPAGYTSKELQLDPNGGYKQCFMDQSYVQVHWNANQPISGPNVWNKLTPQVEAKDHNNNFNIATGEYTFVDDHAVLVHAHIALTTATGLLFAAFINDAIVHRMGGDPANQTLHNASHLIYGNAGDKLTIRVAPVVNTNIDSSMLGQDSFIKITRQ